MLAGEAVVLLGGAMTDALSYVRKQSGQLASKMRFVSAQFVAMYSGDLWARCAGHANAMARRLADGAAERGVGVAFPVQANEVFLVLADGRLRECRERFHVLPWEPSTTTDCSIVRWVASWDTTAEDVDAALALLQG